jgi:hypothetical protein
MRTVIEADERNGVKMGRTVFPDRSGTRTAATPTRRLRLKEGLESGWASPSQA